MGSLQKTSRMAALRQLIQIFQTDVTATKTAAFLSTLSPRATTVLIAGLNQHSPDILSTSLLRALWTHPPLRSQVMVQLVVASPTASSNTVLLLDELGLLLAADARDHTKPVDQRLHALSQHALAVCTTQQKLTNVSHLLVPVLVLCARAASVVTSTSARRLHASLISYAILVMRSSRFSDDAFHTPALISLLEAELNLSLTQQTALLSLLENAALACAPHSTVISLVRAALSYMTFVRTHYHNRDRHVEMISNRISLVVLLLLRRVSSSSSSPSNGNGTVAHDLLVTIEIFIHDHACILSPIVRALSALTLSSPSKPLRIGQFSQTICTAHLVLLFSILETIDDDSVRDIVSSILETILQSNELCFDRSQVASSSSSSSSSRSITDSWRYTALRKCVCDYAMQTRSAALLRFFEGLMWHNQSPSLRKWAFYALCESFAYIPSCREILLRSIFSCLTDIHSNSSSLETKRSYAQLFLFLVEDTTRTSFAFVDCQHILVEALQSFTFMPTSLACMIIPSFISIAFHVPVLFDPLLIFLRKVSSSRAQAHQHIASAGFISIVSHQNLSTSVADETTAALARMIDIAHPMVRSLLVLRLVQAISNQHFPFNRIDLLSERIANRLCVNHLIQSPRRQHKFIDLSAFFTLEDQKYFFRDPIALLLRFCALVRNRSPATENVYQNFVSYVKDEQGAIMDACATDKSDTPVLARVILLCSLLQTIFLYSLEPQNDKILNHDTSTHLRIYGIALVIRDYLLNREGYSLTNVVDPSGGLACSEHGLAKDDPVLTAREGISTRNETMRIEKTDLKAIPMNLVVRTLTWLNSLGYSNVFTQMVKLEFAHLALAELSRICSQSLSPSTLLTQPAEDQDSISSASSNTCFAWSKELITCIQTMFKLTCPWTGTEVDDNNGNMKESTDDEDDTSLNSVPQANVASISHEESDSTITDSSSTLPTDVCGGSTDADEPHQMLIKRLCERNDKIKNALQENRFGKMYESARISVRESSMKMILLSLSNRKIDNEWDFVRSLCTQCLSSISRSPSAMSGNNNYTEVKAIKALTELFRTEFASSMSVGLTSSYLELVSLLLDRIQELNEKKMTKKVDEMKKEIGSLIMFILKEYSIRHVGLLRQMVRIILRALDEKQAVLFGDVVLNWLGNHAVLVGSPYSGADDVRNTHLASHNDECFDDDIVEEALLIEQELGMDNDDEASDECYEGNNNGINGDVEGSTDKGLSNKKQQNGENGENKSTCDPKHLVESGAVRSLCLSETADGAVASICCVLSQFTEIIQQASRLLRQVLRNERLGTINMVNAKHSASSCCHNVGEVIQGIVDFVRSEFVSTCFDDDDKPTYSGKQDKLNTAKRRRRHIRLAWPTDLQRKFSQLLASLTDLVDVQLRILHRIISHNPKANDKDSKGIAVVCAKAIRAIYEEPHSIAILQSMPEEMNKRLTVDERVENASTTLVSKWERIKSERVNPEPKSKLKDEQSKQSFIDDVVNIAKPLFSKGLGQTSIKKGRTEWWKKHMTTEENASKGTKRKRDGALKTDKPDEEDLQSVDENDGDSNDDEVIHAFRTNKKQRLRSRNEWIDQYIFKDKEQESYVDLENFVVQIHEDK